MDHYEFSKPLTLDRTKEQRCKQTPTITPGTSLSSVIQTAEMDKGWIQQQQQQKQQALHVDVKPSRSRSAHVSNQQYLDSTHPTQKARAQSLQVTFGQYNQHLKDHLSRTLHGPLRIFQTTHTGSNKGAAVQTDTDHHTRNIVIIRHTNGRNG
mmetsp:Transcript_8438/g.10650  ORF Transcript_8438/g.10650 Transcript_8438/m.10650 type:complete len:153 (+) Transcript_8438:87-545(+)